ncbi:hypothetical protein FGRMN_4298 [Fusarium graminum]|nr:hypothetical protein FGRMN_4298 [Fusarium graminum]
MEFLGDVLSNLEPEVEDAEEEMFMLFSQPIPSMSLGFVDARASSVDVSVGDKDYTIHQSPTVLSSTRSGGTTGAAPSFATWLASPINPVLTTHILTNASILELGCGISPLSALALGPRVARYVLTDQSYVQRLIQRNLDENVALAFGRGTLTSATGSRGRKKKNANDSDQGHGATQSNIRFTTLDWETDQVTLSLTGSDEAHSFDAVVACDCVYNYALVDPFVQACADACRLRLSDAALDEENDGKRRPCLCVIGQQLRSDEVFESWLKAFTAAFHVWRVSDDALPKELRPSAGFVVHVGILRDELRKE